MTVTGTSTASRMRRRHSPTCSGSLMSDAPKHLSASFLFTTRADGHPQFRLISSYRYSPSQMDAACARRSGDAPPSCTVSGCSSSPYASISGLVRQLWTMASWLTISVQRCARRLRSRQTRRKWVSVHSSIGATDMRCESITPPLSHRVDATGGWGCDLLDEAPSSVAATIALLRSRKVFSKSADNERESLDRVFWVVLIRPR